MDTLKIYRNWKLDEVNQRKSFREEALKTRNFDSYKSEDLKKSNFFKSSSINFNIFSSPKPQKQYEKYCRSPTEEKKNLKNYSLSMKVTSSSLFSSYCNVMIYHKYTFCHKFMTLSQRPYFHNFISKANIFLNLI